MADKIRAAVQSVTVWANGIPMEPEDRNRRMICDTSGKFDPLFEGCEQAAVADMPGA